MIDSQTLKKWVFILFILIGSLIFTLSIIFLIRPGYLIDDMSTFVEELLSSSLGGKLNIGSIDGNFIMGFRLNEVEYHKDTRIIFSAQEIYIDPDISHIILGTLALSEVNIKNSYYNHDNAIIKTQTFKAKKNCLLPD